MTNSTSRTHHQYGLMDEDGTLGETYANRRGGPEQPGVGPVDSVDSSGHRIGAIEDRPNPKPASRQGTSITGETDDKTR